MDRRFVIGHDISLDVKGQRISGKIISHKRNDKGEWVYEIMTSGSPSQTFGPYTAKEIIEMNAIWNKYTNPS